MALVFYEAVCDNQCDRNQGEVATLELWQTPPNVGDEVLMGSSDRWQVVQVEPYCCAGETVYLAFVSKGIAPSQEQWAVTQMLQLFPNASISIYLSSSRCIMAREWSMEGTPGAGQLEDYEPTGKGTLMQPVSLPWTVDQVEAYLPNSTRLYSAIHLCWCKEILVEAVA